MRWIKKVPTRDRQRRQRLVFALFPITMSDDKTVVWLETYRMDEEFRDFAYPNYSKWVVRCRTAIT